MQVRIIAMYCIYLYQKNLHEVLIKYFTNQNPLSNLTIILEKRNYVKVVPKRYYMNAFLMEEQFWQISLFYLLKSAEMNSLNFIKR